jgi:hypothetical protein
LAAQPVPVVASIAKNIHLGDFDDYEDYEDNRERKTKKRIADAELSSRRAWGYTVSFRKPLA